MDLELLFNASVDEIKKGYKKEQGEYTCLFCGYKTEKGIIYPEGERLYDAEKYISVHIEKEHDSVFESLIRLDKKFTGLSEHQSNLMKLFYEGKSDTEIQDRLEIKGSSTIRNHRFILKEKERQAKLFLALMEILGNKNEHDNKYVKPHNSAKMVDDRYKVTRDESENTVKKYFPYGTDGPLKTFDMKEKSKLVILKEIAKKFRENKLYTEKEVNSILEGIYHDFATLRRYLIEYGFMDRKSDGSHYWLKVDFGRTEVKRMDRKKELKQEYKELKTEAGIYQVKNKINGKVFVAATSNLKRINGVIFQLQMGGHKNAELQKEWKEFGEDAFTFDVLEVLEEKEDVFFDSADELKKLEKKWLEKLQPYGEKGYNK